MIWVDGYKWPPDIHGTGSEDYLNQAYGMQRNAYLRNGSSIHEDDTGGYQTSSTLYRKSGALRQGNQGHDRARPRQSPLQRGQQCGLLVR